MSMVALLIVAFLGGSLLGGQLISRHAYIGSSGEARDYGVLESIQRSGLLLGLLVAVFDIGKAILVLALLSGAAVSAEASDWLPYSLALATIFGHIFSPFAKFSGGKPVAVVVGCLAVLMPLSVAVWVVIWLLTATVFRYASLASLLAAGSLPVFAVLAGGSLADRPMLGFALVVLAMTIFSHRPSIRAMQLGSEPTLSVATLKKKREADES